MPPADKFPSGRTEGTGGPAREDARAAGIPAPLRIGDRVPLPPRKLDVRPNGPIDNRPSFRPARNGR